MHKSKKKGLTGIELAEDILNKPNGDELFLKLMNEKNERKILAMVKGIKCLSLVSISRAGPNYIEKAMDMLCRLYYLYDFSLRDVRDFLKRFEKDENFDLEPILKSRRLNFFREVRGEWFPEKDVDAIEMNTIQEGKCIPHWC